MFFSGFACCFQVNLGHGVMVNAANLHYVSRMDPTKTAYTLCEVVFTRHELANSSMTGRKSNAFLGLAVKEKLDENRVQAVVGALTLCMNTIYGSAGYSCQKYSVFRLSGVHLCERMCVHE